MCFSHIQKSLPRGYASDESTVAGLACASFGFSSESSLLLGQSGQHGNRRRLSSEIVGRSPGRNSSCNQENYIKSDAIRKQSLESRRSHMSNKNRSNTCQRISKQKGPCVLGVALMCKRHFSSFFGILTLLHPSKGAPSMASSQAASEKGGTGVDPKKTSTGDHSMKVFNQFLPKRLILVPIFTVFFGRRLGCKKPPALTLQAEGYTGLCLLSIPFLPTIIAMKLSPVLGLPVECLTNALRGKHSIAFEKQLRIFFLRHGNNSRDLSN